MLYIFSFSELLAVLRAIVSGPYRFNTARTTELLFPALVMEIPGYGLLYQCCILLTHNGDHPDKDIGKGGNPHSSHEEGQHVELFPEPFPAVRHRDVQQHHHRHRQNPEYTFHIAVWHLEHTVGL